MLPGTTVTTNFVAYRDSFDVLAENQGDPPEGESDGPYLRSLQPQTCKQDKDVNDDSINGEERYAEDSDDDDTISGISTSESDTRLQPQTCKQDKKEMTSLRPQQSKGAMNELWQHGMSVNPVPITQKDIEGFYAGISTSE